MQLAGPHAEKCIRGRCGGFGADLETGFMPAPLPQANVGRVKIFFPGLRPEHVSEKTIAVGFYQPVCAGCLHVPPSDRQVVNGLDLIQPDGTIFNARADGPIFVVYQKIQNAVKRLGPEHNFFCQFQGSNRHLSFPISPSTAEALRLLPSGRQRNPLIFTFCIFCVRCNYPLRQQIPYQGFNPAQRPDFQLACKPNHSHVSKIVPKAMRGASNSH